MTLEKQIHLMSVYIYIYILIDYIAVLKFLQRTATFQFSNEYDLDEFKMKIENYCKDVREYDIKHNRIELIYHQLIVSVEDKLFSFYLLLAFKLAKKGKRVVPDKETRKIESREVSIYLLFIYLLDDVNCFDKYWFHELEHILEMYNCEKRIIFKNI